jgi:predicted phage terminase large subunit-like protein
MTRWHEDDLAGRLLKQEPGQWEIVSLPALAEVDDPLHRNEGEALWPERFPVEQLLEKKKAVGSYWWSAMYQQRPVPQEGGFFKNAWIQFFDPRYTPYMDTIIQSWDTAQTKSSSSDFVVGQVWGKIGADFYLLDQKRGRWDFDETVNAIKEMTELWPQSSAKIVEAQTLGAALASHLKHQIPGIIPISVKAPKELRAQNCLPVWQAKNVYIPKPDDDIYRWVYDYVRELTTFPNSEHDDQVDATTLALNQLRGSLFEGARKAAVPVQSVDTTALPNHYYFIGWVPARQEDHYTVLVFDYSSHEVVLFNRYTAEPIDEQLTKLKDVSRTYNRGVVRAFEGTDDALLNALEQKGVYVEPVKLNKKALSASYENLSMLLKSRMIVVPQFPDLLAELEVFKSEFSWNETPDYSLQVSAQSAIHALCLVTYDLSPELIKYQRDSSIYYGYDRERLSWPKD